MTRPGRTRLPAAMGFVVLLAVGSPSSAAADSDQCILATVRVDTSLAQDWVGAILGEAVGESFVAADTLIRSISVWWPLTPEWPWTFTPSMKLWITRANSYGAPMTYPEGILLEGPTKGVSVDTAVVALVKVRIQFTFDPPFRLPGPGRYAFFVQDPCTFPVDLFAHTSEDAYPDGRLWRTGRANFRPGCPIGGLQNLPAQADLIFEIEFCHESATPVLRKTWGQLKTIYR